jgi:hypothetical protein
MASGGDGLGALLEWQFAAGGKGHCHGENGESRTEFHLLCPGSLVFT